MSSVLKRQPIPFGKYLLLDRVNIGGMAEVWRGKSFGAGGFERIVAIKRILPNIAEDDEFISMFIDEAKITVQLNHANIAQIYELSHVSSSYFIAMEYISGKDMRAVFDRCRKRGEPAPIPLVCYCIAKCCEGLDYAHRKTDGVGKPMNIVHRDVSPQNVIVSYDGEVKVIDFGIAKAAGKATKTQAGILKGKFGYMSPEQIRGLPLDRRSDVFGIGICLYEMLTGERLFVGDSDFSVLEKVRKVEVLPPSTYNRKIPGSLEKIVMKALAREVEERYQYASELADDLQRFLLGQDSIFGRKDLAQYMKSTFAEELDREKSRLQEYASVEMPEGMTGEPGSEPASPVVRGPSRSSTPLAPVASPSLKLTAASPLLSNENQAHLSTMAGGPQFGDSGPNEIPTDATVAAGMPLPDLTPPNAPPRPSVPTERPLSVPEPGLADTFMRKGGPPILTPAGGIDLHDAESATVIGLQHLPMARVATPAPPPQTASQPSMPSHPRAPTPDFVPQPGHLPVAPLGRVTSAPEVPVSDGAQLQAIFARYKLPILAAASMVVLVIVLVVVLATRAPEGLLFIELPNAKGLTLNINGQEYFEDDGAPLRPGPKLKRVPAGTVTVMITAEGYDTLVETLQVKEGSEYTRLNGTPKPKR